FRASFARSPNGVPSPRYDKLVWKLLTVSVELYPCVMVKLVKTFCAHLNLVKPLYEIRQLGIGRALKGLRFTLLGSCLLYAARKAGINTSCDLGPYLSA